VVSPVTGPVEDLHVETQDRRSEKGSSFS
jgi:hypothetical protein